MPHLALRLDAKYGSDNPDPYTRDTHLTEKHAFLRLTGVKVLITALLLSLCASAQTVEPEMSADRPGFRNSTHLIGPGVVQLENGFSLSTHRTFALEQPEIRIGALSWLEFRVSSDKVVLRSSPEEGLAGVADLQPSIKFPIFNVIKGTRVVGILKSTVPSGHSSQTTGGYQPGAELVWDHEVTEVLSLSGTWNLTRLKQERFVWQRAASVAANTKLPKRFKTFAEIYVISPAELGSGNQWAFDAGVQRPVGEFLMVDASAGHSIHGPRDWFVSVGFSVRTRVPGFHGGRR